MISSLMNNFTWLIFLGSNVHSTTSSIRSKNLGHVGLYRWWTTSIMGCNTGTILFTECIKTFHLCYCYGWTWCRRGTFTFLISFFFLNSIKFFKLAISNYMHPFISSLSHLEIAKTKKKRRKFPLLYFKFEIFFLKGT